MGARLVEPTLEQVLAFCAAEPIERVFLEDAARRGTGHFTGVQRDGRFTALLHAGANLVPSGEGCAAFAAVAASGQARMILGEERAVSELWRALRERLGAPREDRPGQPVYALERPPPAGNTGLRAATREDVELLLPACAAAHEEELGINPLEREPEAFRWRTEAQVDERRSWLWREDGTILFKAEASAWTPKAVQLQQVWVDPHVRNRGYGKRGLADLCRLLLARTPAVCLFARRENAAAIRVYEAVGMRRVLTYRSVLL
jgi:GNAT superfamily N-acetyltransferase